MIAALYVQKDGAYYGIDGVDPWDEERDARLYDGPWPVVAHPPCNTWSVLAPSNVAQGNIKAVGDDGGCFEHALETVRKYGGVLEHPAYTLAWGAFGLLKPQGSGWSRSLYDDGWVCEVSQWHYGHRAAKKTWLYAADCRLPSLNWDYNVYPTHRAGHDPIAKSPSLIRIPHHEASDTPEPFKQILIDMARSVKQQPQLRVA